VEVVLKKNEYTFKNKDGLTLFAREWHSSQNPKAVITLIHGLGEHSGRYHHVAGYFCNQNMNIASFDLQGHGKSEGARGYISTNEILLDDIDLFLNKTKANFPGVPFFIYGHSLGAVIALAYAIKRKPIVQGIVASAPSFKVAQPVPPIKITLAKIMSILFPAFSMDNGLDRGGLSRDESIVKAYNEDPLVHPQISARLGMFLIKEGMWLLDHADELTLDTLLMAGSLDRIISIPAIQEFAYKTNRVTLKIWDGLYHEIHNEPEKEKVLDFILEWFQKDL